MWTIRLSTSLAAGLGWAEPDVRKAPGVRHYWFVRADLAVAAVRHAASVHGVDVTGEQVLRVGENAVVLLPQAGALARVVPGEQMLGQVQHELEVSRWLASVGEPVVRPVVDEPTVAAGCVVVFWEYLVGAQSADLVTLAQCLRQLHRVPVPVDSILSAVEPFGRFEERLRTAAILSPDDKRFLVEYRDELANQWNSTRFDLPTAVVHGDAHMENLLRAADGRLAFVDLESVAIGPPEWDLTLTALYLECDWFTPDQYDDFVEAYGFDVRASSAWPVLRGARMLRMITWLAQSAGDYPERAAQLRHRLESLRDGTAPAGWTGY
jgi:hypothetical protein